jgi:hypothetical protein
MRVVCEDGAIEKRGLRDLGGGRRLGYLQVDEVAHYIRTIKCQLECEKLYHWATRPEFFS